MLFILPGARVALALVESNPHVAAAMRTLRTMCAQKNLARGGHSVLDYIRLYADSANRAALDALKSPKVERFDYDWGINGVHAPVATGKHAAKEDEQ